MSEAFIIAIDFGTTYSGYAYSLTPRHKETEPHVRLWGQEHGHETPKTPTCVLFDDRQEFLHFGYNATLHYLETNKEEAKKLYFFENFKMCLYKKQINKDLVIRDVTKKPMSALKVFSEALRFLKDEALKTIFINSCGIKYIASDFTWVLTVPAIWDNSARQFMREAAVQAGIVSRSTEDQLVIALEPEAASVWCKKLPSEGFITETHDREALQQAPGTQYIVADCGGGTIDITVHEVLEGGALKELHKASGNDKGGRRVDRKFTQCMREFFCEGLWEEYERDHPSEAQRFMYDFAIVKVTQGDVKMNCYCNLGRLVHQRQKKNSTVFNTVEGMTWDNGKIIISGEKMKLFFHESLVHITDSVTDLLNSQRDIHYILLVGGFAQSSILREHVCREFGHQVKVLCPKNPQEAIMKGAVMFGRDPSVIRSRKSPYTYGLGISQRFEPSKHKLEKKFTNREGHWCGGLFSKLVEMNEDVGWNKTKAYIFGPIERDQKKMQLTFYRTERKNSIYVDEWGVGPVASCAVDMPDINKGMNRQVQLEVFFGFTEIKAKATDLESKCEAEVTIDFINKL